MGACRSRRVIADARFSIIFLLLRLFSGFLRLFVGFLAFFRDFLVFSRSTFFRVLNFALLALFGLLLGFGILGTFYGFSVAVRLCLGLPGLGTLLGQRFLLTAFFRGAPLLFTILLFLSVF